MLTKAFQILRFLATKMSTPSPFATLPIELIGQILSHVNDTDLWLNCRNVSSLLRHEAEREFALRRLKTLQLRWETFLPSSPNDDRYAACLEVEENWLAGFSEDTNRAYFHFTNWCGRRSVDANSMLIDVKTADLHDLRENDLWRVMEKQFRYKTVDMLPCRAYMLSRDVSVGDLTYEIELPGLEIDFENKLMSFKWKEAMSLFYLPDAVYRRYRKRTSHPCCSGRNSIYTQYVRRMRWEKAFLRQIEIDLNRSGIFFNRWKTCASEVKELERFKERVRQVTEWRAKIKMLEGSKVRRYDVLDWVKSDGVVQQREEIEKKVKKGLVVYREAL